MIDISPSPKLSSIQIIYPKPKPDKCQHGTIIYSQKGAICQDCRKKLDPTIFCDHKQCMPLPNEFMRGTCMRCGVKVTIGTMEEREKKLRRVAEEREKMSDSSHD